LKNDNILNGNSNFTKTFKVRNEAILLYKFLEFNAALNNISKNALFDKIVRFMLDYFACKDFNVLISAPSKNRVVKGFTISDNTLNDFIIFREERTSMKRGEIVEAAIGLYAFLNIDKTELDKFNLNEWFNFR